MDEEKQRQKDERRREREEARQRSEELIRIQQEQSQPRMSDLESPKLEVNQVSQEEGLDIKLETDDIADMFSGFDAPDLGGSVEEHGDDPFAVFETMAPNPPAQLETEQNQFKTAELPDMNNGRQSPTFADPGPISLPETTPPKQSPEKPEFVDRTSPFSASSQKSAN